MLHASRFFRAILILTFLAVNMFVIGLLAYALTLDRDQRENDVRTALENVTTLLDHDITESVGKIDYSLRGLADELERELVSRGRLDSQSVDALLRTRRDWLSGLADFHVIDASGALRYDPREGERDDLTFADRDYFIAQRVHRDVGLIMSNPIFGRAAQTWLIIFSRRFNLGDGGFAGVVTATIPVEDFARRLGGLDLGPHGVIVVRSADTTLIARQPTAASPSEQPGSKTISTELADFIASDVQHKTFHIGRAAPGGESIQTYRRLAAGQFIVMAGRTADDYLMPWRATAEKAAIFAALFLSITSAAAWLLWRFFNLTTQGAQALLQSEERYRSLFTHMQIGFTLREIVTDEAGRPIDCRFLAVNDAFLASRGFRSDEVVGKTLREIYTDSAKDTFDWIGTYGEVVRTGTPVRFEAFSEASQVWSEVTAYRTAPGQFAAVVADINERKAAEAKIQRLTNLYAALSQCNQAIVHSKSEGELFPQICRDAVRFGGMQMAWIGLLDEASRRIRPVASFNDSTGYLEKIEISTDASSPFGGGPSSTAVGENRPYWCQDLTQDQAMAPWQAGVRKIGCASIAALPLTRNGTPIGCLVLYSTVTNAFDEDAQRLLVEMASDISFALDNFAREAERRKAQEKITELAFFDQLTGLPNRILLIDRLKQAVNSRSERYGALLFIDLDDFKTLNDTLGHDKGDLLLKQVAERLTASVRTEDTVARFGGDEFVLVLPSLNEVEADAAAHVETVGEKVLAALNQLYALGDVAYRCTPSIGVTLFKGQAVSVDDLLKQADLAMYKSKAAGRNTIRFFDPAMQAAVIERVSLEADLNEGLQQGQFSLHYQPQIVGDEGGVVGAEVLLRWRHPDRGMVSPAEFIPVAEETGLILPLGEWVLETACRQLAAWARQPDMAHLTLAVNVSARQFHEADFVSQVMAVIERTGANPQRLKLELTESLLVANVQDIIEKMVALKAKGTNFSLDDFGTGYSSLSYLKRLPLEQLKIDQSFVRDVLTDPNDAAIARTIVALAQSLGLGVIAEGVETEEQRDFLAGLGCHAYQGYFFSRPLTLETFEDFVREKICSTTSVV
ncbi:MAG TPA: EAL domain-containing protein [Telmatospirillum sp.]|nr:EAL domain-containing protein [Telmatospirillum sp.]